MKKTSIILATLLISGHSYASDQIDDYDFYPGASTRPVTNQDLIIDDFNQRTASTDETVLVSDDEGEINLTQADLTSIAETVALIENYMNLASVTLTDLKTKLTRVMNAFEPDDEVSVVEEVSPVSDEEPAQIADEVVPVTNQEVASIQDDDVEFFDDWDSDADAAAAADNLLDVVVDQVTPAAEEFVNDNEDESDQTSEPAISAQADASFVMDDVGFWDDSTEEVAISTPDAPAVTRIIISDNRVQREYYYDSDDSSASDQGYITY